ncbi:TolC family protein [Azospira restricta]|uniref:TolC family protein n=1 Tax=Azospira restricta TaxID=404405 RepID=A0A974SQN6_9RHOO|nr:TolC family protein [Azospira restricta]QRJ64657.1 TolC family protein [Azospira restricta]
MFRRIRINWLPGLLLGLAASGAWAQAASPASPVVTTLRQAFDAAWARQPEAQSLDMRRAAALARRESADSWSAEPPALEVSGKTDQLHRNDGSREYEIGLAAPLWLPGERASTAALADAEVRTSTSRTLAAQLRTAAAVRAAYWDWQRARIDVLVARERLANARELTSDVSKRVRAGDLARADQHQADGALATAEAALAEASGAFASVEQQVRSLTGVTPAPAAEGFPVAEAEPVTATPSAPEVGHPAVAELRDRAELAQRSMNLAGIQGRANPELRLATTRERGASGESWQQTVTVGVRIPFGSDTRNRARVASASAEAIEAESQLRLERERLATEVDTARVRVESARTLVASAERRAQLAHESRGFFQKAFRLGETDLPTRLRIELEAAEAERQVARTRIELAAAVSALRQAMGLLPE